MIPSPGPVHKHLVVEGVRMDVDGGDLEGLAVGGMRPVESASLRPRVPLKVVSAAFRMIVVSLYSDNDVRGVLPKP